MILIPPLLTFVNTSFVKFMACMRNCTSLSFGAEVIEATALGPWPAASFSQLCNALKVRARARARDSYRVRVRVRAS